VASTTPGADGELLGDEVGIAHAVMLGGEVVLRVLEFVSLFRGVRPELAEGLHEQRRALVEQGPQDGAHPRMGIDGALAEEGGRHLPDVFARAYPPKELLRNWWLY